MSKIFSLDSSGWSSKHIFNIVVYAPSFGLIFLKFMNYYRLFLKKR